MVTYSPSAAERALCREVQLDLAYRWFCGLGIEDDIPDHSAFSRARNARFRDSDIFRHVFEQVVGTCIAAGLVGGEGFAVDASLIQADANRHRSIPGAEWNKDIDPAQAHRAVKEYLATLDDPAYGAASSVAPEVRLTIRSRRPMDQRAAQCGILRLRRQLSHRREVRDYHGCRGFPGHSAGRGWRITDDDRADRSQLWHQARMARGGYRYWLVYRQGIAPHVPVIDKSQRDDGTFNREDFTFDKERNVYICPAGKSLTTTGRLVNDGETTLLYFASVLDCRICPLRARCCPRTPARRIPRSIYEEARDVARGLARSRRHSSNHAAIARRSRCCSHTSSAFCGLVRSAPSRSRRRAVRVHAGGDCTRTFAGWQCWPHGLRQPH